MVHIWADLRRDSVVGFEDLQHLPVEKRVGGIQTLYRGSEAYESDYKALFSHQACWVLLARRSSEVMCERAEVLHSRLGLPLSSSKTVFTSRAHCASDS